MEPFPRLFWGLAEYKLIFLSLTSLRRSLAQAKANASLFAPLLEGLKRRLWL